MREQTIQQWFEEFDIHLMRDEKPSRYFDALAESGAFPRVLPFDRLFALRGVEQSPKHHPEGNVWRHTMLVVDGAANCRGQSADARALMWAALLHDLGKLTTTRVRHGRITAYDHDKAGAIMAAEFLTACGCVASFVKSVAALIRWHMQPLFVLKNLPYADLEGMTAAVDIGELSLLALSDRLGRGQTRREEIEQERADIDAFAKKARKFME